MNDFERVVTARRLRITGPKATAAWLAERGLYAPPSGKWRVSIALADDLIAPTAHLHLYIESHEWGFRFSRDNMFTWIRVQELPRVQERDDFELLAHTPALRNVSSVVQHLEDRLKLRFRRAHASIRTNLLDADDKIRLWVVASL